MATVVTLQDQLAELRMMMVDRVDPAHAAAEAKFVALVAEVLRGAEPNTPAMMPGTAEAYDPLALESAPTATANKTTRPK